MPETPEETERIRLVLAGEVQPTAADCRLMIRRMAANDQRIAELDERISRNEKILAERNYKEN